MHLYDGEIHEPDPDNPERYRRVNFKRQTMTIGGASTELVRTDSGMRGDREMSIGMMADQNRKYREKADSTVSKIDSLVENDIKRLFSAEIDDRKINRSSAIYEGLKMALNRAEDIISKIDYESRNYNTYMRQINSRDVEIHKKFSIPFACIAFILIGAPLGVMTRKGGMATSIGLSLFFFIIYWAFLIGGEELADRMYLPGALAMWLPNIITGTAGIVMIYIVNKRTTIEGMDFVFKLFSGSKK
jgi:lipopolysaccharide export system permease protein